MRPERTENIVAEETFICNEEPPSESIASLHDVACVPKKARLSFSLSFAFPLQLLMYLLSLNLVSQTTSARSEEMPVLQDPLYESLKARGLLTPQSMHHWPEMSYVPFQTSLLVKEEPSKSIFTTYLDRDDFKTTPKETSSGQIVIKGTLHEELTQNQSRRGQSSGIPYTLVYFSDSTKGNDSLVTVEVNKPIEVETLYADKKDGSESDLRIITTRGFQGFLRTSLHRGEDTFIAIYQNDDERYRKVGPDILLPSEAAQCHGRGIHSIPDYKIHCVSSKSYFSINTKLKFIFQDQVDFAGAGVGEIVSSTLAADYFFFTETHKRGIYVITLRPNAFFITYGWRISRWTSPTMIVADTSFPDRLFMYGPGLLGYQRYGLADMNCTMDNGCSPTPLALGDGLGQDASSIFVVHNTNYFGAVSNTGTFIILLKYSPGSFDLPGKMYHIHPAKKIIATSFVDPNPFSFRLTATSAHYKDYSSIKVGGHSEFGHLVFKYVYCGCEEPIHPMPSPGTLPQCRKCTPGCHPHQEGGCYYPEELKTKGYGPDLSNPAVYLPCEPVLCLHCPNSYRVCEWCKDRISAEFFYGYNKDQKESEVDLYPVLIHPYLHICLADFMFSSDGWSYPRPYERPVMKHCKDRNCATCMPWRNGEICVACRKRGGERGEDNMYPFIDEKGKPSQIFNSCYKPLAFGQTYGVNHALVVVSHCRVEGCLDCLDNIDSCNVCSNDPDTKRPRVVYYGRSYRDRAHCVPYVESAAKVSVQVTACDESMPHCTLCGYELGTKTSLESRQMRCLKCRPGFMVTYQGTGCFNLSRVKEDYVPHAHLADYGEGLYWTPCAQPECEDCWTDPYFCRKCIDSTILNKDMGKCVNKTAATYDAGYCRRGDSIIECPQYYCHRCTPDCSQCLECYEGFALSARGAQDPCWRLYDLGDKKKTDINFYPGYGVIVDQGIKGYARCEDPNCRNCYKNIRNCTVCERQLALVPIGAKDYTFVGETQDTHYRCLRPGELPPLGYGITGDRVAWCDDSLCDRCEFKTYLHKMGCVQCREGYSLVFFASESVCRDSALAIKVAGWGRYGSYSPPHFHKCVVMNCSDCWENIYKCTVCQEGFFLVRSTCHTIDAFPEGFGVPPVGTVALPCAVPGCRFCNSTTHDYTICDQCLHPFVPLPNVNRTCAHPYRSSPAVLQGFGLVTPFNVSTLAIIEPIQFEKCYDSKCLYCISNYRTCEQCRPGFYMMVEHQVRESIVHIKTVCTNVIYTGYFNQRGLLRSCQISKCQSCVLEEGEFKCIICEAGYARLGNVCVPVNSNTLAPGYGPVLTTERGLVIIKCLYYGEGCLDCSYDARRCIACNNNLGYYLYENATTNPSNTCIRGHEDTAQNRGLGMKRVAGQTMLVPCLSKSCKTCLSNYKRCESCFHRDHYIDQETGECMRVVDSGREGRPIGSYEGRSSVESEYRRATRQDDRGYWDYNEVYKDRDLTEHLIGFQEGDRYRLTWDSHRVGRMMPCLPTHLCKNCREQYTVCTSCHTGMGLAGGACKPQILSKEYLDNEFNARIAFRVEMKRQNLTGVDIFMVSKDYESRYLCKQPSPCRVVVDPNNPFALLFTIAQIGDFYEGSLVLKRTKESLEYMAFLNSDEPDYFATPFMITGFRFLWASQNPNSFSFVALPKARVILGESLYEMKVEPPTVRTPGLSPASYLAQVVDLKVAYTGVNLLRAASSFVMVSQCAPIPTAMFGTEIFSTLFMMDLFKAPPLNYSQQFLKQHTEWNVLIVDFGTFFRTWRDTCSSEGEFLKTKIQCNFLIQYGQNIFSLILLLSFCSMIKAVYDIRYKLNKPGHSIHRKYESSARRVMRSLGMPYFFAFTSALQLPITVLALFTLRNSSSIPTMQAAVIASALWLAYFFGLTFFTFLNAEKVWSMVRRVSRTPVQSGGLGLPANRLNPEVELLEEMVDFRELRFEELAYSLEGLRRPISRFELHHPVAQYLRSLALGLIVVYQNTAQPSRALEWAMWVEGVYLLARVTQVRIHADRLQAAMPVMASLLTIGYYILKIDSLSMNNEDSKQRSLGSALNLCLFGQWILVVLQAFYSLLNYACSRKTKQPMNHDHLQENYRSKDNERNGLLEPGHGTNHQAPMPSGEGIPTGGIIPCSGGNVTLGSRDLPSLTVEK